jgi:IS5 family transposase
MNIHQVELVSVESLVPQTHPYRKLKSLLDFHRIAASVDIPEKETGALGFGTDRLVICCVMQFMEDLSDREMERFIAENTVGKWFCDFRLTEKTPDYSTLCKFRNRVGVEGMQKIFREVRRQLKKKGHMAEVFTFVDSTALVSRMSMWEERDKAIQAGYERFNNEVINKVAKDPEIRIGSKGKDKFWFGFKKHVSVDMQSGMINEVSVTKANVSDSEGVKEILPKSGAVNGDKGYVGAIRDIVARGLHPMIILRNNMKEKNRDKDRWYSSIRAPYERTFSKQNNRTRYRGVAKNQAAECLYAVAYNFRRLLVLSDA